MFPRNFLFAKLQINLTFLFATGLNWFANCDANPHKLYTPQALLLARKFSTYSTNQLPSSSFSFSKKSNHPVTWLWVTLFSLLCPRSETESRCLNFSFSQTEAIHLDEWSQIELLQRKTTMSHYPVIIKPLPPYIISTCSPVARFFHVGGGSGFSCWLGVLGASFWDKPGHSRGTTVSRRGTVLL